MANAAMELLESSLETRLENTFHIKAKLSECADRHRIAIVASLLYAYDQSWKTDSLAVVVGNNSRWWSVESGGGSGAEDNRSDEDKSANVMVVGPSLAEVAQLKKWLIRVGVGHLAGGKRLLGVQDKKGFAHLLGALMDTTETHHGSAKLKQMVRQIVQKQNRSQLLEKRLSSRRSNVPTAAAADSTKKRSAAKSDAENAGDDVEDTENKSPGVLKKERGRARKAAVPRRTQPEKKEKEEKEKEATFDESEAVPPKPTRQIPRTPVKPPPRPPPTVNVEPAEEDGDDDEDLDTSEEPPKLEQVTESGTPKRSVSPHNIDPDERYPSFHSPKPDKAVARARSKSKSPLVPVDATAAVPKRNLIPTGRQIVRTPQVELAKQPKVPPPPPVEDDTEISEECPDTSRNLSRVSEDEMEDSSSSASGFVEEDGNAEATPELESKKKNVIPPGAQIPRTPFVAGEGPKATTSNNDGYDSPPALAVKPKGKYINDSQLPPTPPTEENTGMTKLGAASKRKRTSSGDGERGKLVLEVVEPAVDEPEEKVPKAPKSVDSWLDLEEDIPAMPVLNSLTKNRVPGPQGQRKPTKAAAGSALTKATGDGDDNEEEEEAMKDIEATVETLPSLTKERAKSPKKRPQSRKKNKTVVDNSLVAAEITENSNVAATESSPILRKSGSFIIANELAKDAEKRIKLKRPANRDNDDDGEEEEEEEAMKDIEAGEETLPSLTKERARSPKKRLPSRRRNQGTEENSVVASEVTESGGKPESKPDAKLKNSLSCRNGDDDEEEEVAMKDIEATVETLPSLTKERVKTPKRRPPSRKNNKTFVVENPLLGAEVTDPKDVELEVKPKAKPKTKPEATPENSSTSRDDIDNKEEKEAMKDIEAAVETLPSITKERAKTPKKRPPSRKKNKSVVENSLVIAEVADPKDVEIEGKPKAKPKTKPEAKPQNRPFSQESDDNEEEEEAMKDIEARLETLPSHTKERVKSPKKRLPSRRNNKGSGENSLVTAEVTDSKDVNPEGKPGTKPKAKPEEKPENEPVEKPEPSTSSNATKMKGRADIKKGKKIIISRKRASTEETRTQKEEAAPVIEAEGEMQEEEKKEEEAVPAKKFRLKRGTANVKTDVKPEGKPNTKPEDKPKVNPETKPENKPVDKSENKPENKPVNKPESNKLKTKAETKPKSKPIPKPEAKPDNKPKKPSPLKRELAAGNSSDCGPARKIPKSRSEEAAVANEEDKKTSGKRRATIPGTPPLPRISNRKKGAINERDDNSKIADATADEIDSSGGRAPPAKEATAEAEEAAKRPSPPARKVKKADPKASTKEAAAPAAAAGAGPSTPGLSRARGRRCLKCDGCKREDCAKCAACLDKPKFGGKGTKKQACLEKACAAMTTTTAKGRQQQQQKSSKAVADSVEGNVDPVPVPSTASVKLKDDVYTTPKRSRRAAPQPPLASREKEKVADEVYQSPKPDMAATTAAGAGAGGRRRTMAAATGGIKALDGGDLKQQGQSPPPQRPARQSKRTKK